MASRRSKGGVSAPPTVLPFPKRNKGRIRNSASLGSMGEAALRVLEHWGHPVQTGGIARPFRPAKSAGEKAFEALIADVARLPRPLLDHLIERCIARMDETDGDPDLEPDDPTELNGDEGEALASDGGTIQRPHGGQGL